jgi:hypothetical protein
MTTPEAPIASPASEPPSKPQAPQPPSEATRIANSLAQLVNVTRANAVATISGAMISRSKKVLSLNDVMRIQRDVNNLLFPTPMNDAYKDWYKAIEDRLDKSYP